MNDIAFFVEDNFIYWHSIVMALAVVSFVLCAAGLRMMQGGDMKRFTVMTVIAIPLSLLSSRFIYAILALESFDRIPEQMVADNGGNSLIGAAIGVVLTVLGARICRYIDNMADMFDCITPAASLGICIGRLSAVFGNDDRGMEVAPDAVDSLITCQGPEDGQRVLAVFAYEAICAAVLFAATLIMFLWRCKKKSCRMRPGDIALIFLSGFGASQGFLESMRTDSLTMIGLGFVRVLQIAALLCLLASVIVFSVRAVLKCGMSRKIAVCWLVAAAMLALAIYMEFTLSADWEIQVNNYTVMINCLIAVHLITMLLYNYSRASEGVASTVGSEKKAPSSDLIDWYR